MEVIGDQGPVRVPPGRQQVVLCLLLLEINRVVPTHRIVDVLWRHDPPETARTQVQICVSRLRKLLGPTGAVIETVPPGYQLISAPETVDAQLHSLQVKDAAILLREGRREEAAALLRDTVGLWRGAALSGADNMSLASEAAHLEEERVDATEAYLNIELELGRHTELVSEINALVEAHPLRENLRAQLMLALYRSGRQAEALEVYRVGRDLLVEELGLEPGRRLRDMERAVLAGDPALSFSEEEPGSAPPAPVTTPTAVEPTAVEPVAEAVPVTVANAITPFQLPTATADFVGRRDVVDAVESTLEDGAGTVGVAVLLGRAGVGKSSTAVRIAHDLADRSFPDGQLYCDMRGSREVPLGPADVLARFLRALGVPGQGIPEDTDERSAMYRGLLAGRRLLILLDDAADESQLRPLIPGDAGCGVIITSRARLTGLPGAVRVEMGTLSESTSLELLGRVLGPDRVRSEPEAAQALVQAVGRLPLALRIVAARLAARPHWPMAAMVERLSDERRRLDELAHGDMTVRASLSLTHDGLDDRSARVFSLFGLAEGPTVPAWAAGAVLDDDRPFPSDMAEPLVDAHMLDVVGADPAGEPVYRFHELVRDYAREKLDQCEDPQARAQALERLLGGWLSLLEEANHRLSGAETFQVRGEAPRWSPPRRYVDRLLADPYVWLEAERANLRHAVAQAAKEGLSGLCWELAVALSGFLDRRGYMDDLTEVYDTAMPLMLESGDRLGAAALDTEVGFLLRDRHGPSVRQRFTENALAEFVDLGHEQGEMLALTHLAFRCRAEGDYKGAIGYGERALEGLVRLGNRVGQRRCLLLLGYLRVLTGETVRGWAELEEALALAERIGDVRGRAQAYWWIGRSHLHLAEYGSAVEKLTTALELVRRINDPNGEAALLKSLGKAYLAQGQLESGRSTLLQARSLYEELRDQEAHAMVERMLAEQA
ncbi:AfsR/SARP family transcriptional regulator [Nocardiopsis metallicus]|uniref:DNA-binding SARP family transcriptional activator n=1 Tax=Nocardiopsis metallicus TaxID=179819 RepID=A0A840W951_9ACTN|nr:AfsR/SARP family transcriptional regulator [Nocardiopsis metallicus]MBB5493539.1 DNA-binding SARP family transcriptional activator [Nocardiopsis metallicus]